MLSRIKIETIVIGRPFLLGFGASRVGTVCLHTKALNGHHVFLVQDEVMDDFREVQHEHGFAFMFHKVLHSGGQQCDAVDVGGALAELVQQTQRSIRV